MTHFYRFRSVEQLLGERYAELERQTIFFAAPEDLNDPMEGPRDIVWVGDRILWSKLFKNYVHYLSYNASIVIASGETPVSDPEVMPCRLNSTEALTPEAKAMAETAWASVGGDLMMNHLINGLADSRRRVRRPELILCIRAIHKQSLEAVRRIHIESKMISPDAWPYNPVHYKTSPTPMDMENQMNTMTDETIRRAFAPILRSRIEGIQIDQILDMYNDSPWLMSHVPSAYVMELCRMAKPNLYMACFTTTFTNTSMWSHYGDRHRGACLIFQGEETSDGPSITLNQATEQENCSQLPTWSPRPMLFHKVQYGNKYGEIDFFNAVGNLTTGNLRDFWYTDGFGQTSSTPDSSPSEGNRYTRKERGSNTLHPDATVKTKDWEYEQEHRLVLSHGLEEPSEAPSEAARAMSYNFRSLEGIIFGMEMSNHDKRMIMEIIGRKCIEDNNPWFRYHQAYYSPEHGGIVASPFSAAILSP